MIKTILIRELFLDYGYYFILSPSPDRIEWRQHSFGNLNSGWETFHFETNVSYFYNQYIIDELLPFQHPSRFILTVNGEFLDRTVVFYDGLAIDLQFDRVEAAIISHYRNERYLRTVIGSAINLLKTVERIGGYNTFDVQLKQNLEWTTDFDALYESVKHHIFEYQAKNR